MLSCFRQTNVLHWPANFWTASILNQNRALMPYGAQRLFDGSHASMPGSPSRFQRERSLPDCGRSLLTDELCLGVPPGGIRGGRVRHRRLRGALARSRDSFPPRGRERLRNHRSTPVPVALASHRLPACQSAWIPILDCIHHGGAAGARHRRGTYQSSSRLLQKPNSVTQWPIRSSDRLRKERSQLKIRL